METYMKNLESIEDSHEYFIKPQSIFKYFTATIYETADIFQDVVCYPTHLDGDVLDIEIKMMILIKPESIRMDIEAALWSEYRLTLGNLKFEMAPINYSI